MADSQSNAFETALYPPLKAFLENKGYNVKGEICGCDIVAVRPDEPPLLIVLEMKLSFTLELLLQAVDRMPAADELWLAVTASRQGRDRDRRVHRLCRLLGLGLLAVDVKTGQVAVLSEPSPYRPRPNPKRRRRILTEHGARRGDPAPGGSTRQPIMTAYRQRALDCAAALQAGPLRPRDLRPLADDAGSILLRNVYGWFERVQPGVYRLGPAGKKALEGGTGGISEPHQLRTHSPPSEPSVSCSPGLTARDAADSVCLPSPAARQGKRPEQ
jgi:hypothetical protein